MKRPRGKKALLLGIPIGLAVAGGLVFTTMAGGSSGPPPVPDPKAGQHGIMLALEDRVINLQTGGPYRYAKVSVTVEVRPETAAFYDLVGKPRADAEKEAITAHSASVPLLLDALGTIVSASDSKTLNTPDGRKQLKASLTEAMKGVLGDRAVLNVYFTDLVMQ